MMLLRAWLVMVFLSLTAYSVVVVLDEGLLALLPTFFGDMMKLGWQGQFNFDFMMMLSLSAIWVSWRHGFTPAGLGLGVLAFFLGALFLSAYLFIISFTNNGDAKSMAVGPVRVAAN